MVADPMQFSVLSVLILLGAVQGFFLAVLLLRRRPRRRADGWLIALMCAYGLGVSTIALGISNVFSALPHLVGTTTALPFLYGPLHYLYVRDLGTGRASFRKRDGWHFLPFLAYTLYLVPFYAKSAAYKHAFFQAMLAGEGPPLLDIMAALKALHGLFYLGAALYLLRHSSASHISASHWTWLWRLTLLTVGLWLLNAGLLGLNGLGVTSPNSVDAVMGLAIAGVIYGVGYLGLRQPSIFVDAPSSKTTPKYERSGLDPADAETYARQLHRALAEQHLYRQSGLTLPELARALDVPAHQLSQVINDHLEQNFFDLVNAYRVEEAQRRLGDPDCAHWTMLAIADEAGFGSRSAFNAAFKKHVGMTPSQYKKRALNPKKMS